jgi:glycosyltransferase involved in cell wall biosynthesis
MAKLSLCMIVKATDDEATLLDRALSYVAKHVDEICITITGENRRCEEVCRKYGAKVSHFKWINDFAAARNFNFSQATGDYIFWIDADDVVRGAEKLKSLVEKMDADKIDAGVMNYLYDFDKYKRCTVKHLKTRLVKKGSVTWVGEVHEDFKETRLIESFFIKDVEILHITNETRVRGSFERNLEIAKQTLAKLPNDPRSYWLVANAYRSLGKNRDAMQHYEKFIFKSNSDDEKYLAYLNMADILKTEATDQAILYALKALNLRPRYPNAYFALGEYNYTKKRLQVAKNFYEIGLQLPVPELEIIVYNPRDYDYNPLLKLMRICFDLGEYQKAMLIIEKLIKMYPEDEDLKQKKALLDDALGELMSVDKVLEKAEKIKDRNKLKKYLDNLSDKLKAHPKVCLFRNIHFIKETSSGKDLVFYCAYTEKEWNPDVAEKDGVGGSEEAVINLAKRLAKHWNVTVYNNCGKEGGLWDNVTYRPFWMWNYRDKQDVVIIWRHPKAFDFPINAPKLYIDLHDVIPEGEFTPERLEKITKIFVKTEAHRRLFPLIPDNKFAIIPNGLDPKHFEQKVERNPYLILNTSSADRHLDATLDIFEKLIEKSDKPWKLAWYYGWRTFDNVHENNQELMAWKQKQVERFERLKAMGRAEGGTMISHGEIAKKYLEAGVFLYPTEFYEIHCISAAKAQAAGCRLVTSDFAALNETVKHGTKIHTKGDKWGWSATFGDTENTDLYINAILDGQPYEEEKERLWALETFNWDTIAEKWHALLSTPQ